MYRGAHYSIARQGGGSSVSVVPPITDITRTRPKMIANLALTSHTLDSIQQILTATPTPNLFTTSHIPHLTMPLPITQLHRLHGLIQSSQDQTLSRRVLFHHFRITAMSTLIPSERTLKISLDNTIHTLTPLAQELWPPHIIYTSISTHTVASPISSTHVLGTMRNPTASLSLPAFRVCTLHLLLHGADQCCV